jgi:hypothetical protein
LIERTRYSENRTALEAIEEVVSNGDYTFIYIGAVSAHVIPHDTVSEGNLDAFVEALKKRMSQRNGDWE